MPILKIRSTTADQSLSYVITGSGTVTKYDDPNDDTLAAGANDQIHEFSDGTYIIVGHTNNQYGDAYDVSQEPDAFRKYAGESGYTITYNGNDISGNLGTVSSNDFTPDWIDDEQLRWWYITRYPELVDGTTIPDAGSTTEDGTGGDDGTGGTEPSGMYLDGGPLEIASTSRTPAMKYTIEVDGSVDGGASLESDDSITPGEPTVIEGHVGPSGADTYYITGYIVSWTAVNTDTGTAVEESEYSVNYNGDPVGVWELLGEQQPEYLDDSAAAIGGGQYYSQKITESGADYTVTTLADARDTLHNRATSGDIVFVPGDVELYSPSKSERMHVPSGVTFASDRGVEGSNGALLHTDAAYSYGTDGLVTADSDARVTGFRIRGPHPDVRWRDHTYDYEMSGIEAVGTGVEVDNNEVWGWAVCINQSAANTHIHHNHVHRANMKGLGYGVLTSNNEGAIIEYNRFAHWRHVVAGNGYGGYEFRYNIIDGPSIGHALDQHSPGGTYTDIHHNTSTVVGHDTKDKDAVFVAFRGQEVQNGEVYKNWVQGNTKMPLDQPNGWTDEFIIHPHDGGTAWQGIDWWDNHLGETEPSSSDVGAPR